jgi:hypothetical protein
MKEWMKLFLCLIKHLAVKTYGGMKVWLHVFTILAVQRGEFNFTTLPLYI